MLFEDEDFKKWKKDNGYIVSQHLPGGSLITIIRKWAWDNLYDDDEDGKYSYWSVDGYIDKVAVYFRIFGLEATLIYPKWWRDL